jgi:putative tricarboxylic transport membrane protein
MDRDSVRVAEETRLPVEDGPGAASGKRDIAVLVIAAALFGLAALIVSNAFQYPIRRSYAAFGPEIFPYIVAAGVTILAVITVVLAMRGDFEARERLNTRGIAWIIGALIAEIALLYGGSGFIIASAVLFGGSARGFGRGPLALTIGVGLLVSALLYVLFKHGLGLSLPGGPVERVIDLLMR